MTTVHLSEENWKIINRMKQPGESVNDVITKLLQYAGIQDLNVLDNRGFDEVLDEFIELQNDSQLDKIIEQSRKGYLPNLPE